MIAEHFNPARDTDLMGVLKQSRGGWIKVPSPVPMCDAWQRDVKDGHLLVFVGVEAGKWHLSISHRTNSSPPRPGRNPKWNEIKQARYQFTPPDVTMAMILPPPDEYVNVMDTCFHLYEIDGDSVKLEGDSE